MFPRYACRALNSHTKEAKWRISQKTVPWYETPGAYSHTKARFKHMCLAKGKVTGSCT